MHPCWTNVLTNIEHITAEEKRMDVKEEWKERRVVLLTQQRSFYCMKDMVENISSGRDPVREPCTGTFKAAKV